MLNAAVIGLGWWGKELVRSVQNSSDLIRFSRGVTLEPELAREFAAQAGLAIDRVRPQGEAAAQLQPSGAKD